MSIETVVYNLEEHLVQPGCPVCQVGVHAARRYVKALHWELINDQSTLEAFLSGWGYCPEHTRLVVQMEQQMFKDWYGTNILYESLSRYVRNKLAHPPIFQKPRSIWKKFSSFFLRCLDLDPKCSWAIECSLCETAQTSAQSALSGLISEMDTRPEKWQPLYLQSDGLCLAHLRQALEEQGNKHPSAMQFILEQRIAELGRQADAMGQYARKISWHRHYEENTEEELHAWEHNLAFFSGYPASLLQLQNTETEEHA